MAYPNDMSRLVQGLANYSASSQGFTNPPKCAGRNLIRRTYVLRKPAADAMAADTTAYTAADQIVMPRACRILGARIQPQSTLTAHASNNATVNVVKGDGAAGAAVVCASLATDVAGGNWAAGVTKTMTVTSTAANALIPAGGVLSFNITKAASGVVVPIHSISVDVEEEGTDGYT